VIAAGTRLGPYEIISALGAGGMGEVWKARDTRLGREVAIKVLPASFSQDKDRLRRFEQEAKAAGILNHPNITAVHDVGTHEAAPYVVQELLEGETLRSVLAGGRLSPRKAIDYSLQIMHGLAAAHEKGIVHRDLKPENIFVTHDGRVKILDFGLAKLVRPEASALDPTSAPTASLGTEPGVVMGTIGYMSPEQVKGQPADHRSDLFSFGSILYEMLSGHRPFRADSAAETMSAILKEDPPELSETKSNFLPGLERLVRHCLEKNPAHRFQSASDLAYDLESLSELSRPSATRVAPVRASSPRFLLALAGGLAAVGVIAAAGYFAGVRRTQSGASRPVFKRLTFRRGLLTGARFAADGKTAVYSASWEGQPSDVFLARADGGESKPFGLPNARVLSVSRADQIAVCLRKNAAGWLHDQEGMLAEVPLLGGPPRPILEDVADADWSPDGKEMAVVRVVKGKFLLEFPVGTKVEESVYSFDRPRVSPDGRSVVYIRQYPEKDEIIVADRAGAKKVMAAGFLSGPVWRPSGREIWFTAWNRNKTGSSIRAVRLDGSSAEILAIPDDMGLFDVRADGTVLIERRTPRGEVYFRGPHDARDRNLSWLDTSRFAGLSADGRTILIREWGSGGGSKGLNFVRPADGSPAVRVGEGRGLDLSPDGKWVLALLDEKLILYPTGAGQARDLPTGNAKPLNAQFFPDGRRILLAGSEADHELRLWTLDLSGGPPRPLSEGSRDAAAISPDGKLVAARFEKEDKTFLLPVDGGERRPVLGTLSGETPIQWSDDARWLYVLAGNELQQNHIYRIELATGRRELWKEITPDDPAGVIEMGSLNLTPDGRAYGYQVIRAITSDLYLVEGLK
jgi:Tol biopolymer transport system component